MFIVCQYKVFQWHCPDDILCSRRPPASTMNSNNACQSEICKIRFRKALDHVKELHTHLQTLGLDFKGQVNKTTRHIQHVKYLKKAYLQYIHRALTDDDILMIMDSAGVESILTLPRIQFYTCRRPARTPTSTTPTSTSIQKPAGSPPFM